MIGFTAALNSVYPFAAATKGEPDTFRTVRLRLFTFNVPGVDEPETAFVMDATDRYTLARWQSHPHVALPTPPADIETMLIGLDDAKMLAKRKDDPINVDAATGMITYPDGASFTLHYHRLPSDYPNTDRLWPTDPRDPSDAATNHVALNAKFLARLAKLRGTDNKPARSTNVRFTFDGPNKPVVAQPMDLEQFTALIVPIRTES